MQAVVDKARAPWFAKTPLAALSAPGVGAVAMPSFAKTTSMTRRSVKGGTTV